MNTKDTTKNTKKENRISNAGDVSMQVYDNAGKEVRTVQLPAAVFGMPWNPDLVHSVVVSMQANARAGTAHAKDRSEVRGGGKKPWRQKGTGRARHGSRRSPIWVGGGATHGPRTAKDYSRKINKKARAKALGVTLSRKRADSELILLNELSFSAPRSQEARNIIDALANISGFETLGTKKHNTALIVLPTRDEHVEKSFRNFGNISVSAAKDINPVDLLTFKYIVMVSPEETAEVLQTRVAPNRESAKTAAVR